MNYGLPHTRCTNPACAVGHNHCQACGPFEEWRCRTVLLAENAVLDARVTGLLEQLDEWRARCEQTAALTATTEGGESR